MKWTRRTKAVIAAALLVLAFVTMACTDGACRAPTPCYSAEGHNP